MRTFRNLSYALLFLAFICFFCLISFTQAKERMLVFTLLGVFIAMFSMSTSGSAQNVIVTSPSIALISFRKGSLRV